ncbi:MAG TPA: carbamoyltransferase C-terminal domain-containing protein [Noviherbaspirillum sp.]
MKRNYIGLANSFHDAAVAIVNDRGEVVFAEATERYLQHKRAIGSPADLFKRTADLVQEYCDPDAELVFASSWSSRTAALMQQGLERTCRAAVEHSDTSGRLAPFLRRQLATQNFIFQSQLAMVTNPGHLLEYDLSQDDDWTDRHVTRRNFEHHLTHAAAGCFSSPFDDAVCAILDGYGETSAFACFRYRDGRLEEITEVSSDSWASLGIFYGLVCEACGFGHMSGEEWKVMGLAPYGRHDPELYDLLREMISVKGLRIECPAPERMIALYNKLHGMRRKKTQPIIEYANLAYAGQQVFSEVLFEFLSNLHAVGYSDNLVLGGGCALNSSANGKVTANTPFKNLHVFCAPGDDGNAVGAALLAYHEDHPGKRHQPQCMSPYLGSSMSADTLRNVVEFSGLKPQELNGDEAPRRAAALLAQGKILGWVQGRAEFGPRALGNRSILADPRSPTVKETINARVKFREEFRPFAPSILHEYGTAYFEDYQETPYMERTLKFRENVIVKVPGVVHEDNTGRLQTVKREWNPRYHTLVSEFHRLTDVPLVLNTSFNVMGKPISHSVEDALAVFFTSGLDALFIDDVLIEKR